MIISSSEVKINSQRSYYAGAFWGSGTRFVGQLSQTASAAKKQQVNKDPEQGKKQSGLSDSKDDLMARYSQGRSIRSFGIGSNRRMQSLQMHQIRRQ